MCSSKWNADDADFYDLLRSAEIIIILKISVLIFMARILSIDYGLKRTGIAVTDPLQIIATGLTTVESKQLIPFLKDYFLREPVELIIIGEPKNWEQVKRGAVLPVKWPKML